MLAAAQAECTALRSALEGQSGSGVGNAGTACGRKGRGVGDKAKVVLQSAPAAPWAGLSMRSVLALAAVQALGLLLFFVADERLAAAAAC